MLPASEGLQDLGGAIAAGRPSVSGSPSSAAARPSRWLIPREKPLDRSWRRPAVRQAQARAEHCRRRNGPERFLSTPASWDVRALVNHFVGTVGLGLGLASAIFRARPGLTTFEFDLCAERPGRLATDLGVPVLVEHGPGLFAEADLILLLPGASLAEPPPGHVVSALRAARERGATLAAHCLGVFQLAATGLLDDLNVTTHWQYADQLTARYPRVRVQPEALFIDHGNIVTGAGAAAGIDMCLHLIRRRSFVRHFKAATDATPHAWLLSQRLSLAEELLETTSLPVERIAEQVGYRSAAVFREQFTARRGSRRATTGAPSTAQRDDGVL